MIPTGRPEIVPFAVAVADDAVADLRRRLGATRWPDQLPGTGWQYGTERAYLQSLCAHWRDEFDWRAFECAFNAFPGFRATIGGQGVHFLHVRSPEACAQPFLVTHGWPGSLVEFLDVLGPLSDPARFGGDPRDAFHVVAAALPGHGFSGPTTAVGVDAARIASMLAELMSALGYERFFAQGGDWGALVGAELAQAHPDRVIALHLNLMVGAPPDPARPTEGLDKAGLADYDRLQKFLAEGYGYREIQVTRPQTLAYALNDSPAGVAAWIVEKFREWSDCDGELERSFTKEQLLRNISVYWITGTINSSARLYYETMGLARRRPWPKVLVPTGHARFPAEQFRIPRLWAEQSFAIARWTELPRGGHFPAFEVPDLYVDEVRSFFRDYRSPPDEKGATR